jgi:hypothetical protein
MGVGAAWIELFPVFSYNWCLKNVWSLLLRGAERACQK